MKNHENCYVKCILAELERIITHAEKAIPRVEEGNNQRWEEINFEQLTRESESKLNLLRSEVNTLTNIEIMKAVAEDMNCLLQRFHKFDKEIVSNTHDKLKIEKNRLVEAEKYNSLLNNTFQRSMILSPYLPKSPIIQITKIIADWGTLHNQHKTRKEINDTKNKIHFYDQFIARFEQITTEFRLVVSKLNEIYQILLAKINQATVSNFENHTKEEKQEVIFSSNRGRKKEQWWGGKWENLTEQEVEQRLKQAYEATYSLLSDFKGEKNIVIDKSRNAVWAAVYFYAAETEHLVNPGKKANCISFIGNKENPRGLYNIGVNCNRNTVNNYYKIIKGFLKATINLNSNSPNINLFIQKINDEKNTDEYPSTREWLRSNFKNVTNELGDKDNSSEDIVMFVAKNLQILRRIFLKVQPYFKKYPKISEI